MTQTLLPAVGVLERAIGFTRVTLAGVSPVALADPTPCRGWDLGRLLLHMDDALDAFTEASAGVVALEPTSADEPLLDRLRLKACVLLGAWAGLPEDLATVEVGGAWIPTGLLLEAGALEIAVHGWDVGRATGCSAPLPEDLARVLLRAAQRLVSPADRPRRFGPVRPLAASASYADRLLGFLGRQP